MKVLTTATRSLALVSPLLLSANALAAPYSADFTAGEGFVDGNLHGQDSWSVFDSTTNPTPGSYAQVDTSGTGTLVINTPPATGFQVASYASAFTENNYTVTVDLSVLYTQGQPAVTNGSSLLPEFEFRNGTEKIGFGFRQTGGTTWNTILVDSIDGGVFTGAFGAGMNLSQLGLSVDGSGNWDDGQSDRLRLEVSLVHVGPNQWQAALDLTNLDTNTSLSSIAPYIIDDADDNFANGSQQFRIVPGGLRNYPVQANIDSINIAVPEPSSLALLAFGAGLASSRRRRTTG